MNKLYEKATAHSKAVAILIIVLILSLLALCILDITPGRNTQISPKTFNSKGSDRATDPRQKRSAELVRCE